MVSPFTNEMIKTYDYFLTAPAEHVDWSETLTFEEGAVANQAIRSETNSICLWAADKVFGLFGTWLAPLFPSDEW